MSSASWDRLRSLVERARALPEAQRDGFLAEQAGDDAALLEEARSLLSQRTPDDFLEPPGQETERASALVGKSIGGYVVGSVIGSGGMGVVYRATHEESGQEVALKVLPPLQRARPAASERFRRESLIARHASHEAIVTIIEEGTTSELSWFAMELVDGHDLSEELVRQRAAQRGEVVSGMLLPPFGGEHYQSAVIRLVARLARGLAHGHGRGVLHRDVKPKNVLLDRGGRAFLGDFGLARLVDLSTITRSSDVQGTPHYMSPEQALASRRPVDARSDQYSLGVVLFELLALELPYLGRSSREVLERISRGPARRLRAVNPDLPEDLVVVCEKAMARRPAERYRDCSAFADDLERVLQRRSIVARPRGVLSRAREAIERHRIAIAVLAATILTASLTVLAQRVSAGRAEAARANDAIRAALEVDPWELESDRELDVLRAGVRSMANKHAGAALRDRLRTRVAEERARWIEEVREEIAAGLGGERDPTRYGGLNAPTNERQVLAAQQKARRFLLLVPGDSELTELAAPESTFPRLLIEVDEAGLQATATASPRNPVLDELGAAIDLGPLPVDRRLPPGDWRVIVRGGADMMSEHDRLLERRAAPYLLRPSLRPAAEVTADMVSIPATRPVFAEPRPAGCRIVLGPVDLPAFWIDEAEVSNREYLDFMAATGADAPRFWVVCGYDGDWRSLPGVDGDERWLDLPAVGMNVYDMAAYAEWRGKRLPTHLEAEIALRGEDLRQEFIAGTSRANVDLPRVVSGTNRERYARYVESTLPVREAGYRQPPFGLFHVYGNVTEFTSSRFVQSHEGSVRIHRYDNVRLLTDWDDLEELVPFVSHGPSGIGDSYVAPNRGFRCARSAQ